MTNVWIDQEINRLLKNVLKSQKYKMGRKDMFEKQEEIKDQDSNLKR